MENLEHNGKHSVNNDPALTKNSLSGDLAKNEGNSTKEKEKNLPKTPSRSQLPTPLARESIPLEATPLSFTPSDDRIKSDSLFLQDKQKKEDERLLVISEEDELQKAKELQEEESKQEGWFSKTSNYLKYCFISKETEQKFSEIYEVSKVLFGDLQYPILDMTMSLALLSTFHYGTVVRTDLLEDDCEKLEKLNHYCRFACASYGWKLIYVWQNLNYSSVFFETVRKNYAADSKALIEYTGIEENDILLTKWVNTSFSPAHYIVLDHKYKSVVLCIRGTLEVKDVLIDLSCKDEDFKGGKAHGGILSAAKRLRELVEPVLLQALKDYPGYELVIVGHSLGAGTASLLTMMIHDDYAIPIHCYAFAPPCVVSLGLAKKCKSFITSIILNDDLVPRLSTGSLEDLKSIMKNLLKQSRGNLHRLFQIMSVGNNLGESLTRRLINHYGTLKPDLGVEKLVYTERLFPPGYIYHVFKQGSTYDSIEESDPSLFREILVSPTMASDHFPDVYEKALKNCYEKVIQEKKLKQEAVYNIGNICTY